MDNARDAAVNVLHEVWDKDAYANVALAKCLRQRELSEVDRRFVTELVYGAVKAGKTLDWILRRYVNRPLGKMPPMICHILRLGLYQIFFMDKVPASAACNEAVELAKKYGHAGTVKLVNAVLRTAVREPEKAAFPSGKGHATEQLALSAQHPVWMVKRWIRTFGYEETVQLCDFNNRQAILSLRTNTLKICREELLAQLQQEGAAAEASEWAPEGILCRTHPALDSMASLQTGLFQVQDESSMQAAYVLAPEPGEFVIDACSAPGGKTTHIAALMKNQGRILALDVYDHKLARIQENAKRLGIDIIETRLQDAREIGTLYANQADRVLVDAPCSGLGVLRRKPDARWKKSEELLSELPMLQGAILQSAAAAVRPEGILVYSTCTIEKEENEAVVQSFLEKNTQFVLEDTGSFLPIRKRTESMVQFYPQRDHTDGFFIARMRRKE